MYRKISKQHNIMFVLVVLVLTVPACASPSVTDTLVPATEEAQPTQTVKPTEEVKSTEESQPDEDGGSKDDVTKEPDRVGQGINVNNVGDLHQTRVVSASNRALLATALSPISHQGATFGTDKYVNVWNTENGEMVYQLGPHAAEGGGLAYSPDGTKLASGGRFEVILWDPAMGKKLKSITVNAYVFRISWSPDSHYLAVVGDGSSKIDLVDADTGSIKTRISTPGGAALWAATYSPNGKWIAVGNYKGNITILDAESLAVLEEDSVTAKGSACDMEFSPDSKLLASCNGSGDIYFWDTESWSVILELIKRDVHIHADPAFSGCTDGVFSRGGDIYFSVGNNMVLNAWNTANGKLLQSITFDNIIFSIAVSNDGALLAVALNDGSLHFLSVD
ncbi:MAG: hypothetical protein JXB07_19190 [Anaerolineae bacterium]|nr:hypothetical protein [Anaerolineae bacterium]